VPNASLTRENAARFAGIALGHVTREYPNFLSHGLSGPEDARTPRELHPIFYGSLDWHSCVHGYWMLARLLRQFPDGEKAGDIRALFDASLTEAKVAGEAAYFARPRARGFERPYGWAWLLKLAAELIEAGETRWATTLAPLTEVIVQRFRDFLPKATYPVRVGTHYNTAFALTLAADYADAASDVVLGALLRETALRWYAGDRDCQAWEPNGDDFLSSALIEAECMHRLLPAERFLPWFDLFLPRLATREPATLFRPVTVSDRSDGKIAHLDGVNLSRAWCQRRLAAALPEGDARRPVLMETTEAHLGASLEHVAGDYMGEHWLASFAVLALEA
jgi:hypothetical protein